MLNRISTGGDCDAADIVILGMGIIVLTVPLTLLRFVIRVLTFRVRL